MNLAALLQGRLLWLLCVMLGCVLLGAEEREGGDQADASPASDMKAHTQAIRQLLEGHLEGNGGTSLPPEVVEQLHRTILKVRDELDEKLLRLVESQQALDVKLYTLEQTYSEQGMTRRHSRITPISRAEWMAIRDGDQLASTAVLAGQHLLDLDFSDEAVDLEQPGLGFLPSNLPSTQLAWLPYRQTRALVRDLSQQPKDESGQLDIAANEVGQGLHRTFADGVPLDAAEQALVMRLHVFSDAALSGTNSTAVRLWAQDGFGPNDHRDRMELSTHFNSNARGARQVYPNAYRVRDGWETWAMPEGTNSRRAGIYYRLGAEGRVNEIRGGKAVPRGHYWTWEGLDWPQGWAPPLGSAMYDPEDLPAALQSSFVVTAVFRRDQEAVSGLAHAFATAVDIQAPGGDGRVRLDTPLPQRIQEVRLLLRSEVPDPDQGWSSQADFGHQDSPTTSPKIGVKQAQVHIISRADANTDGVVDEQDWLIMREHFAGDQQALHYHADANGDGRIDLDDAFIMARQWSQPDAWDDPDPSQWWGEIDDQGHLQLHLPADSQLYAWQLLDPPADWHPPEVLGAHALQTTSGEVDLQNPLQLQQAQRLDLGPMPQGTQRQRIRIQTHRGRSALTLLASRSD